MMITGNTAHDVWQNLLQALLRHGQPAQPRGDHCFEIVGVQVRLHNALENIIVNPARNLNYRFMVAEWLWTLLGRDDLASLKRYNSVMAQFSDDDETLAGAYGPRLIEQWGDVKSELRRDKQSRRAVAGIWRWPQRSSRDVPCTLSLQFLLRRDAAAVLRLHTVVSMRSSDVWLGIPYDIFNFTMLANALAGALNVGRHENDKIQLGELVLNLGSSHLYERDLPGAHQAREKSFYGYTLCSPQLVVGAPSTIERAFDRDLALYLLPTMAEPWSSYMRCLLVKSSMEALEVLRAAAK